MSKKYDFVGQKIGRLKVLERLPSKNNKAQWLCECDCGNTVIKDTAYLVSDGVTKSCGCYAKELLSERRRCDLTGQVFGRLTALWRVPDSHPIKWHCKCECGNEIDVITDSLKTGNTKSCGCLQKELAANRLRKHGLGNTRINRIWDCMKTRCYDPNSASYENYGGRGITICDEWRGDFMSFYNWSMTHGYADDLSIDRIDPNKGYYPENCRWATRETQSNNTRRNIVIDYNGEKHTMTQWARILNIPPTTLKARINRYGWSVERAFTEPVRKLNRSN